MTKIYVILDTETDQFMSFGSKCAWLKEGFAKAAFQCHYVKYDKNWKKPKFEEQSRFVVVDLSEYYFMYKQLED